jgi:hypothetical protein
MLPKVGTNLLYTSDPADYFAATFTPAALDAEESRALGNAAAPYLRKRPVLTANSLGDAIRGCDTYALKKVCFGHLALGYVDSIQCLIPITLLKCLSHRLLKTARWRIAPATVSQKALVAKKLKIPLPSSELDDFGLQDDGGSRKSSKVDLRTLTKGEAANIITRLKHGAQVCSESHLINIVWLIRFRPSHTTRKSPGSSPGNQWLRKRNKGDEIGNEFKLVR